MLVLKTKYQKLARLAFTPDGRGLAAGGPKGLFWWPSVLDRPAPEHLSAGECAGLGLPRDGGRLVAVVRLGYQQTELIVFDLATGERQFASAPLSWPSAAVCPATGLTALAGWWSDELSGWRLGPTGAPERVWVVKTPQGGLLNPAAFAPCGTWLVRSGRSQAGSGYDLFVYEAATGTLVRGLPGGDVVSAGPVVSPDGGWIAFGAADRLRVQSATDPQRSAGARNDNSHHFTGLAFHPSGKYLAATNNDQTVKLFDTTDWKVTKTFTWDIGKVRSVAFSPDGTLAAAGSDTGKVVVWDVDV
ncbi:MAG: hypothetical protein K2V38_00095 [Gemmataceae bacterium]|nr:hypothetical protein [Gemmataceae bacterium]